MRDLLSKRMKTNKSEKINQLAERSSTGELSGFSGIFKISPLTNQEQETIFSILQEHAEEDVDIQTDLKQLTAITSEVKAINNQAIILHGERIKKAQSLLKSYKDGAFSSWLVATYGNRQTPYNFLQYFEFYTTSEPDLRDKIDLMPKQVIYSLASREGDHEKKQEVINGYSGESKQELLEKIREMFPLASHDKRQSTSSGMLVKNLERVLNKVQARSFKPTDKERSALSTLLTKILSHVQ